MIGTQVVDYLHAQNLGTKGTNLFLGFMPDQPDDCTAVYEETAPVLTEMSAYGVDAVGIQITARAKNYIDARTRLYNVHLKIAGFTGLFATGGYRVSQFIITSPPSSIGRDEKNRGEWTVHYAARILVTGNTNRIN